MPAEMDGPTKELLFTHTNRNIKIKIVNTNLNKNSPLLGGEYINQLYGGGVFGIFAMEIPTLTFSA